MRSGSSLARVIATYKSRRSSSISWCVPVARSEGMHYIQDSHDPPLLALGGMDGRENRVVLVLQTIAGTATGRIGWIEGQLSEKPLAGSVAVAICANCATSATRICASS